jgi:glycosyltransferase involved in cell wall biosynthesis
MPVYNCASRLQACLDSLFSQEYPSFDVVVVNDGSTDSSPLLLEHHARREPRLRIVHRAHEGLVAALNAGLEACRGALVARMDGDDLCLPGRFALQAAWLDQHPEAGLVSCAVQHGGSNHQAGYARHVAWLNSLDSPERIRTARFVDAPVAHPSVMFRRELVDCLGGWRAGDFPEDYELWLRWLDAGVVFGKVPETLLVWNDPPGRLSRTDPRYGPQAFDRARRPWLERELARCLGSRPLICWGSGRESRRRVQGLAVTRWLDLHPGRIGQTLWGAPVCHRDSLGPGQGFILATVGRLGAAEEIRGRLEGLGYREGVDWLALA